MTHSFIYDNESNRGVTDRGISTVVGSLALIALTVSLAMVVGVTVSGSTVEESAPQARFQLTADSSTDRITLEHRGGTAIDVRELSMRISIDGEPLDRQPPIPFFAARGFVSGPTGPFNRASDPNWTAGDRASVAIAGSNEPGIDAADQVRVQLLVDGRLVADLQSTATA